MPEVEVIKNRLRRLGYVLTGSAALPERCRWQIARGATAWWCSSLHAVERFADRLPDVPPPGFVA